MSILTAKINKFFKHKNQKWLIFKIQPILVDIYSLQICKLQIIKVYQRHFFVSSLNRIFASKFLLHHERNRLSRPPGLHPLPPPLHLGTARPNPLAASGTQRATARHGDRRRYRCSAAVRAVSRQQTGK